MGRGASNQAGTIEMSTGAKRRQPKLLSKPGFRNFVSLENAGVGGTILLAGDAFSIIEKKLPFGKPLHTVTVDEDPDNPGEFLVLEQLDFGPRHNRYVSIRYRGDDLGAAVAQAQHVRAADIKNNPDTTPYSAGDSSIPLTAGAAQSNRFR